MQFYLCFCSLLKIRYLYPQMRKKRERTNIVLSAGFCEGEGGYYGGGK
jgi:hypothetical protein